MHIKSNNDHNDHNDHNNNNNNNMWKSSFSCRFSLQPFLFFWHLKMIIYGRHGGNQRGAADQVILRHSMAVR